MSLFHDVVLLMDYMFINLYCIIALLSVTVPHVHTAHNVNRLHVHNEL